MIPAHSEVRKIAPTLWALRILCKIRVMLSIFPSLLAYHLLAPALLRLVAGGLLGWHGYQSTRALEPKRRLAGWTELALAVLLVIGLWTQPAALLMAILILIRPDRQISWQARALMLAILASLALTGPGLFAFDLPL